MAAPISVRAESEQDVSAIHAVEAAAFGREGEAVLVDALRERNQGFISLVATEADHVVGHICFSRVSIERSDGNFFALAPLAVVPSHQRRAIGSMLVKTGLYECRRRKVDAVFVVGEPAYYSRFGFRPASGFGIRCEFDVPEEAFRVVEFVAGRLRPGTLRYPQPFHEL